MKPQVQNRVKEEHSMTEIVKEMSCDFVVASSGLAGLWRHEDVKGVVQ